MSDLHVGIFGPGLSGKTTLAKYLSRTYWQNHGIKTVALDIHREAWGPQAWVTERSEQFEAMVWAEKSCAVFMDEAGDTINRQKDRTPFFTRIRHNGHKLHVIGHSGSSLLPVQREQFHTLFLFRQPASACKVWAELFADDEIYEATTLAQYEFLWCRLYHPTERHTLAL